MNKQKPFQTLQANKPYDLFTKPYHRPVDMEIKAIESIEKDDQSKETLRLTSRWREITRPTDYRYTQGVEKIRTP